MGITIDDAFWNVGNLTVSKSLLNPVLGGGGSSLNGNDDEKQHYSEIKDIYWKIEELDEYREFLGIIDSYKIVELVLANDGTTYDEDIDVRMAGMIAAIEPTLVIILSVIVGIILLSVMLPLVSIMAGL